MSSYVRNSCRLCGSLDLQQVLTLTPTPPANEFVSFLDRKTPQDVFDLYWVMCYDCAHVQLPVVVDPERLFMNYKYVSGTAPSFVAHFAAFAGAMVSRYGLGSGSLVFEVGSNDGTLLKAFQRHHVDVLGVDPASDIVYQANVDGVPTLDGFFDSALASDISSTVRADLVVANNVFAHVDNLGDMLDSVGEVMKDDGFFVFEVSYIGAVLGDNLFDTIYHEHLSYHGVIPLQSFLGRHGFKMVDVEYMKTHGGTIRVHACRVSNPMEVDPRINEFIQVETAMGLFPGRPRDEIPLAIRDMKERIRVVQDAVTTVIGAAKETGQRVVGFGAPAKATTLMYHFGFGPETFEYIVDDSPLKQGLFSPGLHIPIVTSDALYDPATRPDLVVVLAWNFADPIVDTHIKCGARFLVPLPDVKIAIPRSIPPTDVP